MSIVISFLAVLVPIILYLLTLSEKSLEYEIVSKSELIDKQLSINNLEIKINGKSINKLILYVFKLRNSGNKSILKGDFERPISIQVPDDQKIYLIRLKEKLPENLTIKYELKNNKVFIEPLLLNSEDNFEMELYSSSDEYPNIDARIAGITKLKNKFPDSKQSSLHKIKFILAFFLLIFYAKSFMLAVSRGIYLSKPSIRLGNVLLSIVCGFSSAYLFIDIMDIGNRIFLLSFVILLTCLIGSIWGIKERKNYDKNIKLPADALTDLKR